MANRFLSNIRINDAYTFPASDGTNGQVIKTDGSGNLTFGQLSSDSASVMYKDTFTGDGSTTGFTLSNALNDEVQSNIYIDGVYQSKSTYSVSGTAITFSTAPLSGHEIEVISTTGINSGPTAIFTDTFTANGSTTAFTLGQTVHSENQTIVFLNGVYQFKGTYTLSGTTLTLDTAPANGVSIEVMSIGSAYSGGDILYDHDFTSAGLMTTNGSGVYSITANNSANWNTAYTYSQVGHLPLSGGTLTGALTGTTAEFSGSITVTGAYYDSANSPGTGGQVLTSTATGTDWIDATSLPSESAEKVIQSVRMGEAVSKGDPLVITGYHGSNGPAIVERADATNSTYMPAYGVALEDYANNATGSMIAVGDLDDFDTSSYNVGDTLYVAVGGGMTNVKPTGTALIQNMGIVSRKNANNGDVEIVAIGRTNDVPNLPEGRLFVGTSDNTSLTSDVVYIDDTNDRVGIGEQNPLGKLHIKTSDTGVTSPSPQGNLLVLEDSENGLSILSSTAGAGYINFGDSDDNDIGMIIYGHSSNSMDFWTNASKRMIIDSSGVVSITNESSDGLIIERTGTTTGKYRFGIGGTNLFTIRDVAQSGTRMAIDNSGNVGIGTTTPSDKLSVYTTTDYGNNSEYANATIGLGNQTYPVSIRSYRYGGSYLNGLDFYYNDGTQKLGMRIDSSGLVNIPATADGNKLTITSSAGSNHNIIEMGQLGADGFLDVSAAGGGIVSHLSGYTGYASYFLSDVGIGTTSPSTQIHNLQKTNNRAGGIYTQLNGNNYGLSMFVNTGGYGIIGSNGTYTTDVLTMDLNTGYVGIGDGNPLYRLTVSGSVDERLYVKSVGGQSAGIFMRSLSNGTQVGTGTIATQNNGDMKFFTGTTAEALRMTIGSTGRITMFGLDGKTQTGSDVRFNTTSKEIYYFTSSRRYKTDIVNLENSLDKINALRPVRFKDIKTREDACGLIAEETFEIIPDVVFTKEIEGFDKPQIEGINYSDLVPFLIKSIQELKADNDSLKARIETLENN